MNSKVTAVYEKSLVAWEKTKTSAKSARKTCDEKVAYPFVIAAAGMLFAGSSFILGRYGLKLWGNDHVSTLTQAFDSQWPFAIAGVTGIAASTLCFAGLAKKSKCMLAWFNGFLALAIFAIIWSCGSASFAKHVIQDVGYWNDVSLFEHKVQSHANTYELAAYNLCCVSRNESWMAQPAVQCTDTTRFGCYTDEEEYTKAHTRLAEMEPAFCESLEGMDVEIEYDNDDHEEEKEDEEHPLVGPPSQKSCGAGNPVQFQRDVGNVVDKIGSWITCGGLFTVATLLLTIYFVRVVAKRNTSLASFQQNDAKAESFMESGAASTAINYL